MLQFQDILGSQKDLITQSNRLKLQEQQVLKDKVDALDSKISKAVAETPASTPTPAKSMTLMHVGLLVGGIVIGYFAFKMIKK